MKRERVERREEKKKAQTVVMLESPLIYFFLSSVTLRLGTVECRERHTAQPRDFDHGAADSGEGLGPDFPFHRLCMTVCVWVCTAGRHGEPADGEMNARAVEF